MQLNSHQIKQLLKESMALKKLDKEFVEDLLTQFMIDNELDYLHIRASIGFHGNCLIVIYTDIEDED